MIIDVTKSTLSKKTCLELADELLSKFPDVDRAILLKEITCTYFYNLRLGNKLEERAAFDFLNLLQAEALKLTP